MDPSAASAGPAQSPYNPMVGHQGMFGMQALNFNNILNVKDSRWLQLEVCREFQRNKCIRPDTECKFAHPPSTVEVQNGRVTACYDSIKGRCNREKPPCKYFHPPQHLKDQLLINGRNHLALKNAFMTQLQAGVAPGSQFVHGSVPIQQGSYLATGLSPVANYSPYIASPSMMTVGLNDPVASQLTSVVPQQAFPGMGVPYKRPAPEKSGVSVYQPTGNTAYHQALMQQLGGQAYVPVSCEYAASSGNNLLALPAPNADAATAAAVAASAPTIIHPSPAIHSAVASSSTSSSTSSTSSQHSDIPYSTTSTPSSSTSNTMTSPSSYSSKISTSSSVSGKIGAHLNVAPPNTGAANAAAAAAAAAAACGAISSQSLPCQPVNMLTYAGYSLNKGLRHNLKSPPTLVAPPNPGAAVPLTQVSAAAAAAAAAAAVGMAPSNLASLGAVGYNFNVPLTGVGYPMTAANTMPMIPQTSMAGIPLSGLSMAQGMAGMGTGMAGMGTGIPMMSPQLVYSHYPASSLALPQLTALSSNPQSSLAPAGEQPYKKLKTS